MSGSSVLPPAADRARSVAGPVAVAARGRRGSSSAASAARAACQAGCGDDRPGEAGAAEAVLEVVVSLSGRLVEAEGIQRPAVIGELCLAVGAVDRCELARS